MGDKISLKMHIFVQYQEVTNQSKIT